MKLKAGKRKVLQFTKEAVAVFLSLVLFGIPYYYVIVNSAKNKAGAAQMNLNFPSPFVAQDNYATIISEQNNMVIRGFFNSTIITIASIAILILACAMAGYVLQRRSGKATSFFNFLALAGLMIPPAIVPTIWVLKGIGVYRSLLGMVVVEVALSIPFSLMLYRSFVATIPREIDEAAFVDGCGRLRFFFQMVFPLLKPVTATVIVLSAVNIYNDFVNPLYFLPRAENVTIQMTMYNFFGRYASSWNLLFANVVLISLPPLLLFIFFNKRIVSGMVAGAVKG